MVLLVDVIQKTLAYVALRWVVMLTDKGGRQILLE
jgi:hypothetical protein